MDNMGKKFILLSEAATQCRYSQEYLSLRARQGKLRSIKRGRNWMTTNQWLREYLDYCEGLKEKNKPKAGLIKEKMQTVVPEIEQEQLKKTIKAIKPEIIQNFWVLLFNGVKDAVANVFKAARKHGFTEKILGDRLQTKLSDIGREIKFSLKSFGELLTFINVWIIEEKPRIKIGQILAGIAVVFAVFGFLFLATKSEVRDRVGAQTAKLIDNSSSVSKEIYSNLASGVDEMIFALSPNNIALSLKEAGRELSWQQISQKAEDTLISVNDWMPEKSAKLGGAILKSEEAVSQAPRLVFESAKRAEILRIALKNNFEKDRRSLTEAAKVTLNQFKAEQNILHPKNLSANIQGRINGTKSGIADIAATIGNLASGVYDKINFAFRVFEDRFSYFVFGKPYPEIPSLVILRKTNLEKETVIGGSEKQKAEITKIVQRETEKLKLTEKVTEITRITERVESADLTVLEARMMLQIADAKLSILRSLSSVTNTQINNYNYAQAPAQRIDNLGQVTINGLQWPGDKGTVGQVLTTNGNNQMYWSAVAAGGGGAVAAGWTDDGTVVRLTEISDFVGIGTSSPYAKLSVAGSVVAEYFYATSTVATSTFAGGIQTNLLRITSATATSSAANGIDLSSGCFSINGICISGGVAGGTVTYVGLSTALAGLKVSGSPITTSGTFQLSFDILTNYIPFGGVGNALATSTSFTFNNTTSNLTVSNATTTAFTVLGNAYFAGNGTWNSSGNVGIGTTSPYAMLSVAGQAVVQYLTATSTTATSTFAWGIQATNFRLTSATATSTAASGIDLSSGCFAINGVCVSGGGGGTGTVTYVGLSTALAGLKVSGSPITTFGTFQLSFDILTNYIPFGGVGNSLATSTGLTFTSGTSNLAFTNGSTTALSVSGNSYLNNVAVGTSTVYSELGVWSGGTTFGQAFEIVNNASTTLAKILDNGTAYFIGNVGIGTTSPYAMLSVAGQTVAAYFTATTTATSTYAGGIQTNLLRITSTTATSSAANGIDLASGCFSINGVCVSGGGGGTGTVSGGTINRLAYYTAGTTVGSANFLAVDTTYSRLGIGTTSPNWNFQIAGTQPMMALSDMSAGNNMKHWFLSSSQGNLYIGTSSDALNASTTYLTINSLGYVGIGTTTPTQKLHLSNGNFLIDYSSSTSAFPTRLGGVNVGSSDVSSVYVSGKYAYIGTKNASFNNEDFQIYDISSSSPSRAGGVDLGNNWVTSIYVSGKYAYIGTTDAILGGNNEDFQIYDISNPSNPQRVGGVNVGTLSVDSIYVSGKYAYIGTLDAYFNAEDFQIYDISNPSSPRRVGGVNITNLSSARIYVSGKYAYIGTWNAYTNAEDFQIYDISNPTNPSRVGGVDFGTNYGVYSLYVSGKYAYIGTKDAILGGNNEDFQIYDISNPSNPQRVGGVDLGTYVYSVYVSGKYAYIGTNNATLGGNNEDFQIYDISNPSNPQRVGGVNVGSNNVLSVYVSGKYAYITTKNASFNSEDFQVYDIFGIDAPSATIGDLAVGSLNVWENASINNNLYVNGGLNIGPGGLLSDGSASFNLATTTSLSGLFAISGNISDSNNSSIVNVLNLSHGTATSSLAAASGIGTGLLFSTQDASGFATSTGQIASILTNTATTSPTSVLTFSTKNTSGSLTEWMRLNQNGYLGIGTTSPYSILSISNSATTAVNTPLFTIASTTAGVSTSTLLTVLANGNVGIGTANPGDYKLYVSANSYINGMLYVSTGSGLTFGGNWNQDIITNGTQGAGGAYPLRYISGSSGQTGGYHAFEVDGTERMRITNSGLVGIGTTSPYAKLSVAGQAVVEYLTATSTTATSTFAWGIQATNFRLTSATATSTAASGIDLASGCFAINGQCVSGGGGGGTVTGSGVDNRVAIWSGGSAITYSDNLTWDRNNSRLGIGTTSPNWDLQVAGTRPFFVLSDMSAGVDQKHWFLSAQGGNFYIGTSSDALNATSSYFSISDGGTTTIGNGPEVMRIDSTGNVGIGTSSPYAKLSVVGPVVAEYFTATSTAATSTFPRLTASTLFGIGTGSYISDNSTSTFSKGIDLASGCFAINGACISGGAAGGTVTYVAMTTPVGLKLTGSPITTSGTLGLNFDILTNYIPFGGAGNALATSTSFTFNNTTANLTVSNASTTALSVSGTAYIGSYLGIGTSSPYAMLSVAGHTVVEYLTATSTTATSSFAWGIQATNFRLTSATATSTAANGIDLSSGCFSINGVCVSGGGGGGTGTVSNGTINRLAYYTAGTTVGSANFLAVDTTYSRLGIGTTTPNWDLQIASTSRAILALSDMSASANQKHWFISSDAGNLRIGTSSDALNATSTYLTINNLGYVGIASTSPISPLSLVNNLSINSPTNRTGFYQNVTVNANGSGESYYGYKLNVNTNFSYGGESIYGIYVKNNEGYPSGVQYGVYANAENYGFYGVGYSSAGVYGTNVDAGSSGAGIYANTNATYGLGEALKADSTTITSGNLAYFTQNTSAFTGNGLLMNFAASSGSFTGNFLNLQNNSVTKFIVKSDGTTGIGTTSPNWQLQIATSTGGASLALTDYSAAANAKHWWLKSSNGDFSIGTTSDSLVTNTTYFTIASSTGNVGIGTAVPSQKLDVSGSINTSGTYRKGGTIILTADDSLGNIAVGQSAGVAGDFNSTLGYQAGLSLDSGAKDNTIIGYQAGYLTAGTTGDENTFVGYTAGYNTVQRYNTFIGSTAGNPNTSGTHNTALGYLALGTGNQTGGYNTVVGSYAGSGTSNFSNNSLFGYATGNVLTTGSNNILIGYAAGDAITSGSNNIIIGYDIDAPSAIGNYQMSIGNLIFGTSIDAAGTSLSSGNIGIGTSSPYAKLSVAGPVVAEYFTATSTTATSTFAWGIQATNFRLTSATATSTAANGIDLSSGCFSINGVCVSGGGGGTGTVSNGTINRLAYYTAGTTVGSANFLTVDTAYSRLGIGTTSPNWDLQIASTSRPFLTLSDMSAGVNQKHWFFSSQGGNLYIGTSSDALNATTTFLTIQKDTGYVGIGTVSPTHKLDINGDARIGNYTDTSSKLLVNSSQDQVVLEVFGYGNITSGKDILKITQRDISNVSTAANLIAGDFSETFYDTSAEVSGRLLYLTRSLIGNTSGTLTVSGPLAYLSDNCIGSGGGTCVSSAEVLKIYQGASVNTGAALNITTASTQSTAYALRVNDDGTFTDSSPFVIDIDGNVGIGTTSPYAKLSVAGQAVVQYLTSTSTTATSTFAWGIQATNFRLTSVTATSTAASGIDLSSGCFAINGTCVSGGGGGGTVTGSGVDSRVAIWSGGSAITYSDNLTWDRNNNRLGIGTTSPNWQLQIATSTGGASLALTDYSAAANAKHWWLKSSNGDFSIGTTSDSLATNTTYLTIASSTGYVGIGTQAPTQKLTLAQGGFLQTMGTPTLATSTGTGGETYSVYVSGKYAYVGTNAANEFQIYNIAAPYSTSTLLVGSIDTGSTVYSVYVSGKYAYLGTAAEFRIYDISNPAAPTLVSSLAAGGTVYSVYVSGKYAYLGTAATNEFQIYDISNPSSPVLVSSVDIGSNKIVYSVYVSGRYAYLGTYATNQFRIYDISNPASPSLVSSVNAGNDVHSVYVSGKYAYLGIGNVEFRIYDISNPASPSLVSSLDSNGIPYSVYISGKYAYLGTNAAEFRIYDISNPASPSLVSSLDTGGGYAYSVYVSGKYAYIGTDAANDFQIYDISGIDAPSATIGDLAVGTLDVWENAGIKNNLYVDGGLNVGPGGIYSGGPLSVYLSSSTNPTQVSGYFAGRVGIGTTSPYAKLSVWSSGTGAGQAFEIANNASTSLMRILDNGTISMLGNVGIGTTSPYAKLSVAGQAVVDYLTATSTIATSTFANHISIGQDKEYRINGVGVLTRITSTGAVIAGNLSGNARGSYALDIQSYRSAADQVAAGSNNIAIGINNKTSGDYNWAFGYGNTVTASGGYNNTVGYSNSITGSGNSNYAFGYSNTISSGSSLNVAFGYANAINVDGQNSMAFGLSNSVTNTYASAFGNGNAAQGTESSAFGTWGFARGTDSSAFGYANEANTTGSSAFGDNNIATTSSYTSAFGFLNYASGLKSSAFGYKNISSGDYSSAFGVTSTVTALMSSAFGYNNYVTAQGASAFGSNIINNIASSTQIGPSDFAKLTILNSGNVGIGTTSPYAMLSVAGQAVVQYLTSTSTTATSTLAWGIQATNFRLTSATATSTAANGIDLSSGCFAINGQCVSGGGGGGTVTGSGVDNRVAIWSGGSAITYSDNLTWDRNNNRLGIGTTSPNWQLQIATSTGGASLALTDYSAAANAHHWWLKSSNGDFSIGTTSDSLASNTTYLTIASSTGNVGIGTAAPNNLIQVKDLITFDNNASTTFLGYKAGAYITGQGNTFIGYQTGYGSSTVSSTGYGNNALGYQALYSNTTGYWNNAVGRKALYSNTTGYSNNVMGDGAMLSNTTGWANIAIGDGALSANTTGYENSALGRSALLGNTTGNSNTAVGRNALFNNTTGYQNSAMGYSALFNNSTGASSTAVGAYALLNTTADGNTGFGYSAGRSNTTGTYNLFLGYNAGYTGTSNNLTNATAIGYEAQITQSNSIILGGTGAYAVNVGIGTTSPYAKLSVVGSVVAEYFNATSTTATSTFAWGIQATNFRLTSATATSTAANGIDLSSGCFAINGVCVSGGGGGTGTVSGGTVNRLAYYTAGTTVSSANFLAVDTTYSRLGIGTTSPNWDLQVASSGPAFLALSDMSAGANAKHWFMSSMGGNLYIGTSSDALNATTTYLTIQKDTGYVGIGTANPGAKLEVAGNIYLSKGADRVIQVTQNSTDTTGNKLTIKAGQGGPATAGIIIGGDLVLSAGDKSGAEAQTIQGAKVYIYGGSGKASSGSDWPGDVILAHNGTQSYGNVGIGTTSPYSLLSISNSATTPINTPLFTIASTTAGTATSTLFTVLANGNVGIGTAAPTYKLDVVGDVNSSNGYRVGGNQVITNSRYFVAFSGSVSQPGYAFDGNGSTGMFRVDNSTMGFSTNGVERMRFSSGNVGIGTSSPYAMLSVAGQAVVQYLTSTSTTATSTFSGGVSFGKDLGFTNTATSSVSMLNGLNFDNNLFVIDPNSNQIGIGTSSPSSGALLTLDKTGGLASTSPLTVGMDEFFKFNLSDGTQIGNNMYIVNSPLGVTQNVAVGQMIKIEDTASATTTVRGLEVQAHRGTNTLGENTAISAFGRTFGVRAVTTGEAGAAYLPAGLYAETRGSTQGNAIRGYSGTITSADLTYLYQESTAFSGVGLHMNFGNSDGGSFSGNFLQLQNAGVDRFAVSAFGTTTIGRNDGTKDQAAGLQIPNGGLCVDNDGSCNATTTGRISAVSYTTGNSDLAENYFSDENLEGGDIVYTQGGTTIGKASLSNSNSIIGVVSTKPGLILGFDDKPSAKYTYPVALTGRVPVKVSTEAGDIKIGDKIVLSSLDGVGMTASSSVMSATSSRPIIGVALENFDGKENFLSEEVVQVLKDNEPSQATATSSVGVQEDGCYLSGGSEIGGKKCQSTPKPVPSQSGTTQSPELQISNNPAESQTVATTTVKVGKILMLVNLGWYKLDSGLSLIASGLSDALMIDPLTGKIAVDYNDSINMKGNSILNIGSLSGMLNNWSLSPDGILVVQEIRAKRGVFEESLEVGTQAKPTGITIYDTATGQPYCLQVTNGQTVSTPGKCANSDPNNPNLNPNDPNVSSGSAGTIPSSEPTAAQPPAEPAPPSNGSAIEGSPVLSPVEGPAPVTETPPATTDSTQSAALAPSVVEGPTTSQTETSPTTVVPAIE